MLAFLKALVRYYETYFNLKSNKKTETGLGYGLGLEPIYFSLSNSGLITSSSAVLVLNGDGSIHREVGVIPHIELDSTPSEDYNKDKVIQYILNEL